MSEHTALLTWQRTTPDFNYKTYDRTHSIRFSGGETMQVSSAPEYLGNSDLPNPEELMVGALSSCHMLTFLAIASNKGFIINNYTDHAVGILGKNAEGKMALTTVTLRPAVAFQEDKKPDAATLHQMHEKAHVNCFIANSVTTTVNVEPEEVPA